MRYVQKQQLYEQASEVVADNKAGQTKIGKGKKSLTINTDGAEMASGKYRAAKQKQAFLHNQRQILGTRIIIKNGVILSFLRDRHCLTRYTLYAPAHSTHTKLRLRGSSMRISLLLYP